MNLFEMTFHVERVDDSLVDMLIDDYEVEEDFETAVSVACSLTLDAIGHAREVALVTEEESLPTASAARLLDASCAIEPTGALGLDELARRATTHHPEASVLLAVTGQLCPDGVLGRVRTITPSDTVAAALRAGESRTSFWMPGFVLARAGESPSRAASFNPPAADASSPPCSGPASPPPGLPAADALPAWPTSPARLGLPPGEFVFPLIERSSLTIDETPFGHCDSAI